MVAKLVAKRLVEVRQASPKEAAEGGWSGPEDVFVVGDGAVVVACVAAAWLVVDAVVVGVVLLLLSLLLLLLLA